MRERPKSPGEKIVKDIKRATRKHYSSEEKIRIVLDGLRGEDNEPFSAIGPRTMVECLVVPS
jgi:transposase